MAENERLPSLSLSAKVEPPTASLPELKARLALIDAKLAERKARAELLLILNDHRDAVQERIEELRNAATGVAA